MFCISLPSLSHYSGVQPILQGQDFDTIESGLYRAVGNTSFNTKQGRPRRGTSLVLNRSTSLRMPPMLGLFLLILLHHTGVGPALTFSVSPIKQRGGRLLSTSSTALWESKRELSTEETFQVARDPVLNGAELLEFALSPHRPLGCTVEESLVSQITKANQHYVFVSKVTPGGFAEQAGLRIGDVVVGVSGIFGQLENVQHVGIDRVKGLVQAHPADEPLELRVLRGTNVLEDHERALVELCSDPNLDSSESDECVLEFLKAGYDTGVDVVVQVNGSKGNHGKDRIVVEQDDDMVGNLYNMWADDLPVAAPAAPVEERDQSTKPKAKPWSSRSSPSGTWVRDPKSGEMRNIDS